MDILLKDINKSYGDKVVFRNKTYLFKEGSKTLILGESGIGKTTLLKIIMGLEGIDNGTISGISNKKISVVFQEDRLCENLSVASNISLVNSNINNDDITKELDRVGLLDSINTKVKDLSGGMKRRVAIVRALLFDFDILILDEPFKGLDKENKDKTIELIKDRIKGKTLIMVSHDLEEGNKLCNEFIKVK